jgi:hypothetical protein
MRRLDTFHPTLNPYAVDLTSLRPAPNSQIWYEINALWFRRRQGRIVACYGELRDSQVLRPIDAVDFLRRSTDVRYRGVCLARWNGTDMWAPKTPYALMMALQGRLRRALEHYPDVPAGFDGWWTFK